MLGQQVDNVPLGQTDKVQLAFGSSTGQWLQVLARHAQAQQ
jgi:hypothetical protein